MSIIYDALKKTQNNRQNQLTQPASTRKKIRIKVSKRVVRISSAILLAGAVIVGGISYQNHRIIEAKKAAELLAQAKIASHLAEKKASLAAMPPRPGILNQLIINGIFVSPGYRTALINNQYISVGDEIEGLKVVEIKIDQVKFFDGKRTWTLTRSV